MAQPTLFYAVVVILTLVGQSDAVNAQLAWAHFGIKIVHSLWQVLVNTIPVRFGLFVLSTLRLFALSLQLVMAICYNIRQQYASRGCAQQNAKCAVAEVAGASPSGTPALVQLSSN